MTGPSPAPLLIACAHGTHNPRGRVEIDAVRAQVQALRPGVEVLEAYVDVQEPDLVDVIASLPHDRAAVIVPLLLSVGYHVKVDIARAAAGRPDTVAALPLGPDPRLAHVLQERLHEASVGTEDPVVLAAAGSSDPCAAEDVAEVHAVLAEVRTGPVSTGFGAKAAPSVREAVAASRNHDDAASSVAIASYLLAPGYFHDQLAKAGAGTISAPLLPHPAIAELALERYDDAVARLSTAEGDDGNRPACTRPCRARTTTCVRDRS